MAAPLPERPRPAPPPRPAKPGETPLFEQMDFDELLGIKQKGAPQPVGGPSNGRGGPAAVPGVDALSLDDSGPQPVVLSPQRATLLVVAVVVLLAFAFAAGYLIAPYTSG